MLYFSFNHLKLRDSHLPINDWSCCNKSGYRCLCFPNFACLGYICLILESVSKGKKMTTEKTESFKVFKD